MPDRIIIRGVTIQGRRFRPSDWAQRLTTAVGHIGPDRRIRFHPKVKMAHVEGINCVVIDRSLAEEDPMLFDFLMGFARENELEISEG